MSGLKLFLPWWQAVAFFPVEEAGLFLATIEPGGAIAKMLQRVRLQFLMQQLSDDPSHLLHGETRGCFFPPAASRASGTMWQAR
jgi:hypothetical protein